MFYLKRIEEEPILISQKTRDVLLKAMQADLKYVQVGEFTIMVNSIKSIDPRYPPSNIPPRPEPQHVFSEISSNGSVQYDITNSKRIALWDQLYAEKSKIIDVEEWCNH